MSGSPPRVKRVDVQLLGKEAVSELAAALRGPPSASALELHGAAMDEEERDTLGDGAATALADAIRGCASSLRELKLVQQRIGRGEVAALAGSIGALRVLERLGDHDGVLAVADELFASERPGYVRLPDRRIDLIRWFSEWKPATDEEAVSRLAPYTTDFDENARFAAIEGLAHRAPALIAPPLVTALLRPEEESGRIKRTILEVLARSRAPLGERAPEVEASMTGPRSDFRVDAGTVVGR
jgi:hypothetical protein